MYSQEEKTLEDFKRKFPFLQEEDGLLYITIATPFLVIAGYEPERLMEILDVGTQDRDERNMLLWAYDIGSNLFKSVTEKDDEEADDFFYEALDIAFEILDEDEIEEAYKISMNAIHKLAKELQDNHR